MPRYTFRCDDCANEREVVSDLETADDLVLICFACGGEMTRAPVLTLNVIGPAIAARKAQKLKKERAYFTKPCGHNHPCRCGVKLNRENPFRQEIRAAHGFTDED